MLRRLLPLCLLAALGCGKAKPPEPAEPATADVQTQFDAGSKRLVGGFLDSGTWVISRKPDGSSDCQGEGLLWSGVALATLSCTDGQGIEDGLTAEITRDGGALVRYQPLGSYAGGSEITVDGAIGLYRGIAHRIVACKGSDAKWKPAVAAHLAYVAANGGKLNAAAPAKLEDTYAGVTVGFRYLLDAVAGKLGLAPPPATSEARGLEREVAAWSAIVVAKKAAAYRVNLSLLALETEEELGEPVSSAGRDEFCAGVRGVRIPTVDAYCGVGDIKDYTSTFKQNEWRFRHQRSGSWEGTPDGGGLETPGLDLLVGLRRGYQIPN